MCCHHRGERQIFMCMQYIVTSKPILFMALVTVKTVVVLLKCMPCIVGVARHIWNQSGHSISALELGYTKGSSNACFNFTCCAISLKFSLKLTCPVCTFKEFLHRDLFYKNRNFLWSFFWDWGDLEGVVQNKISELLWFVFALMLYGDVMFQINLRPAFLAAFITLKRRFISGTFLRASILFSRFISCDNMLLIQASR